MTLPSEDWRDTGLAEPDELDPANPLLAGDDDARGEDYHPATARPDLDDRANEADVVEQAYEVSDDDGDEPAET
ncbi:hypothetical protein [Pseudactinotalea sp.]|uniref:hypothetical protein n=1 Tax=Pseudactinotalea sp. TaxID=1926260 RepID=UPI003B3AA8C3